MAGLPFRHVLIPLSPSTAFAAGRQRSPTSGALPIVARQSSKADAMNWLGVRIGMLLKETSPSRCTSPEIM